MKKQTLILSVISLATAGSSAHAGLSEIRKMVMKKMHGGYELIAQEQFGNAEVQDLRIAAAEFLYRKKHNLSAPPYRQEYEEIFRDLVKGTYKAGHEQDLPRLLDSPQKRKNIANSLSSVSRYHEFIEKSQFDGSPESFRERPSRWTKHNFDAIELSQKIFHKSPDQRIEILRTALMTSPPLTHPEYFRILWAFPKNMQTEANALLLEHVFTRLDFFPPECLIEWTGRINLDILNIALSGAHYQDVVWQGEVLESLLKEAIKDASEYPEDEKPLLAMRDALRAAYPKVEWTASDLFHMDVSQTEAFVAKILTMTHGISSGDIEKVLAPVRTILEKTAIHSIDINPDKKHMPSPAERGISDLNIKAFYTQNMARLAVVEPLSDLVQLEE